MKKIQEMQIEYWVTARVKPYAKNARAHPPEQVAAIVRSIKAAGFMKPIIVDERNEILAGHGAFMAAQQLDMEKVPVIQHKGLTQAQKRAYRIADNKVGEGSLWDSKLLLEEFADLKAMGMDLGLTGFGEGEIEALLRPTPSGPTEPPVPAIQPKAVSRPGDLWLLGDHRLYCGDSTKPASLKALMGGREAQCVFTDPPYGISYEAPSGDHDVLKGDHLRRGQLQQMLQGAFAAAMPHVRQDAGWYVWHASATREEFSRAMRDVGLVELSTLIWAKPGQVLGWSDYRWSHEPCFYAARQGVKPAFHGDRTQTTMWRLSARTAAGEPVTAIGSGVTLVTKDGQEIHVGPVPKNGKKVRHVYAEGTTWVQQSGGQTDDVWEVSRGGGHGKENAMHPTMKPVELARRAIGNSTREGEIVLDLFAGASSTLIGAEQTGRLGYALELDPKYVDAGVRRWQELTGKQATHAADKKTFDAIAKARAGKKPEAKAR
jgi:DNA modification methylase